MNTVTIGLDYPATAEPSVWVNFMMGIILDKPIPKVELDGLFIVKD